MEFNQSFTNFTSPKGIAASKKILRDAEKEYLSMEGAAFECGFNLLTSFNVYLKKNIGTTPSKFKKARNKVLSRT